MNQRDKDAMMRHRVGRGWLRSGQGEIELDLRPRVFVASGEEYSDLCRRAAAGEFVIESSSVGDTPGQWVVRVRYDKENSQLKLFGD